MKNVAILIVVVFLATIIVYPLIYGTDPEPNAGPPVELNLDK